jgi:hypothetical protein
MSADKPPYAKHNGSTVDVVDGGENGKMETDFWPSDATSRDELNEKQIKVIEAAVRGEWDSGAQLSRALFDVEDDDEPARTYANNTLANHCPRLLDEIKDHSSDATVNDDSGDASEVDSGAETPATQLDVLAFYREHAADASTVGEYVRVQTDGRERSCFGPRPDTPELGWRVVEIDWESRAFLLAPIAEGQR